MALKATIKRLLGPRLTRRIQQARMPRFDADHAKNWWRTRDQNDAGLTDYYWQSRETPARRAIATAVATLDAGSLLEIGCNAGPNLWAIRQARPSMRLTGTDMSPTVLSEARRRMSADGIEPALHVAAADALPFAGKSFDVCLSVNTLVCIGQEAIDASLDEILRVTRKWLVLCESWTERSGDRPDYFPDATFWIRNYRERLRGRAELLSVQHLPKQDHIGHLDNIAIYRIVQDSTPPR